jgi:hypothetical protein
VQLTVVVVNSGCAAPAPPFKSTNAIVAVSLLIKYQEFGAHAADVLDVPALKLRYVAGTIGETGNGVDDTVLGAGSFAFTTYKLNYVPIAPINVMVAIELANSVFKTPISKFIY